MDSYLQLGQQIINNGKIKDDRTNTGTLSLFGSQIRCDLSNNKIAAITTKKIHFPSVLHELVWMLSGDTNVKYLQDNGVRIWNEWAEKEDVYANGDKLTNYERACRYADKKNISLTAAQIELTNFGNVENGYAFLDKEGIPRFHRNIIRRKGDLGKVYGHQWRKWESGNDVIDQIQTVIEQLNTNPDSRRILVNAWNVGQLEDMNLPPCHIMFQFYSVKNPNGGKRLLSIQVYQRSVDYFLGLPFNLSFYSILCHLIAKLTNHTAHELIHIGGDVHIYSNHIDQVKMQLERSPFIDPTTLIINPDLAHIDDVKYVDFEILNYQCHPHIAGKVAI